MKLKLLIACGAALVLSACGDISEQEKRTLRMGEPIRVGEFQGQPIYYQRVRDPEFGGTEALYIIPGATTAYEQSCGKSCVETIQAVAAEPVKPDPRDVALSKLTPEDRAALGL